MLKKDTFSRFKKVVGARDSNAPGSYPFDLYFPPTPITVSGVLMQASCQGVILIDGNKHSCGEHSPAGKNTRSLKSFNSRLQFL